jgi:hypothetical protein
MRYHGWGGRRKSGHAFFTPSLSSRLENSLKDIHHPQNKIWGKQNRRGGRMERSGN